MLHYQIILYLQVLELCDVEVVIVQTAEALLVVAIVEELNVDFKGVMSCSCPSKYNK